jgi:type I restriction enzyme, S subunit
MYAIAPGKDFERDYLFYFLLTDAFTSYAELASMRVAMPKVNREALGSFPLPKPPIEEQQDVIHFIGGGLLQLDGVATSVNNSVARLIEYRSALITSAVTGQLEGLQ